MPWLVRVGMRTPVGRSFLKSYPFEEAYFLDKALRVREAVSMPLMLLGGINRTDTMERAMELGFDFVAMGRGLLRDPELVNRMARGEASESLCVHCNKCMASIYAGTHCVLVEPSERA